MTMSSRIFLLLLCIMLAPNPAAAVPAESPTVEPLIHPLAAMTEYAAADFHHNEKWHFRYRTEEGERREKRIVGDGWELRLSKSAPGSLEPLAKYIPENATVHSRSESEMFLEAVVTEAEVWWVKIEDLGNEYQIIQARELRLNPGSTLSWNMGEVGQEKGVCFYTNYQGNKLTNFRIDFQSGEWMLKGESIVHGTMGQAVHYTRRFNAAYDKTHILTDFPKGIVAPVRWTLLRTDDGPAATASITLEESTEMPSVRITDELGALKVEGAAGMRVEAEPLHWVTVYHEKLKHFVSDVTPEGDALLWLPAGLWNIRIAPGTMQGIDDIQTRLVPVNSGETTVLTLPSYLASTLARQQESASSETCKGLNITGLQEDAKEGITATFTLFDQDRPDMVPTLENIEVLEGGAPAEIKSIEHVQTPASIVLLLDSSGSMKGQMNDTLQAARRFIASLPEDTFIQVVDFDTKSKVLTGSTKVEALTGLDGIRAGGATALYDSVLTGLDLLNGRERPSLLVFTDGVDANWNDTAPGSVASRDEAFAAVADSRVPLYTIGFGAGHDDTTLTELADLSGGLYYSAVDQDALDQVFTTIKNDLGNTFKLKYQRPPYALSNSVPVISIAIDISGSMDPLKGGVLQKDKKLFHDFIRQLPDQTLMQLQDFHETTTIRQLLTADKSELLQALGELTAGGENDTFSTVKAGFDTLQAIPSPKKILIYVTDEDLGSLRPSELENFDELLYKFKEEDIKVLWVGFCVEDVEDVFIRTAELSGGEYVVSEDPAVLAEAFARIAVEIAAIKPAPPDEMPVTLTVRHAGGDGTVSQYGDSRRFRLLAPEIVEQSTIPKTVSYRTGLPFEPYDPLTRGELAGDDHPGRDMVISKRLPLDATTHNSAVEIRASEAIVLDRFRGLDAPDGMQFMAVILEMTNTLPEQEVIVYPDGGNHPAAWVSANPPEGKRVRKIPSYLIRNLASHLYLKWNSEGTYPVAPATWLAENPLVEPGSLTRLVEPGEPARGVVLFTVPDQPLDQSSLHFYDTDYGHADLALVGKLAAPEIVLEALPLEHEVTLSESFVLKVKAVRDAATIETVAAGKDATFRIVEADFVSNVQALIDINPANYFYYRQPTGQGPFYIPIAPATQLLPFGFTQPVMFAPGSSNRVRFAFEVPRSLAAQSAGELFVELGGGDVIVPLGDTPAAPAPTQGSKLSGDGIDLVVNRLAPTADKQWLVADVTLFDHPDGKATQLVNAFQLVRDDFAGEATASKPGAEVTRRKGLAGFAGNRTTTDYLLLPDARTAALLLGLDKQTVVFDGTARRGMVLFKMPAADGHSWTLQSRFFAGLNQPVGQKPFAHDDWLIEIPRPLLANNDSYPVRLKQALARAIREHQARQAAEPRQRVSRASIDASEALKEAVAVPPSTFAGLRDFSRLKDLEALKTALKGVRWLPGEESGWVYNFAPEAVLTQGWGTEVDFARMAEKVLVRMGHTPQRRMVDVTGKGSEALLKLGNLKRVRTTQLPALFYRDRDGREQLLVSPFLQEAGELQGLVAPAVNADFYQKAGQAHLQVVLKVVPKTRDRNTQLRDMSNVLAGGDSGDLVEEVTVFDQFLDLETLSMDAVDLGYTVVGRENGELIAAVVETARERLEGKESIDTGLYRVVGERISVRIGNKGGHFTHESTVAEEDAVRDRFHTLGINLPDLTDAAANRLQQAADNVYRAAERPDELSALRWYTRNIINRFVTGQSRYERELAAKLDLTLGRTLNARCLMVTLRRVPGEETLHTSIDLMRVENQIHKGEATARHAFNIFSGLHASKLEAEVLPGAHRGLFEIWQQLPEDTHLVSVTRHNQQAIVAYMEAHRFPAAVIDGVRNNRNAIVIPSRPATIDGRERWAWLEINPEDYRTIAVIDSGERGAMLEHVLGNWQQEGTNFIVGGLIGVDAAIWSMGAFSLMLEDYDEIKAQAETFAVGLVGNFDAAAEAFNKEVGDVTISGGLGVGVGGTPGASVSMGPVGGSFDLIDRKGSVSQNVLGYANGFKAGVQLYFAMPE
jgi:hypothetical protein